MPRAISLSLRQQVISLHQQQMPPTAIAQQLAISCQSVRRLIARYQQQPSLYVLPPYQGCKGRQPTLAAEVLRAAGWLKRLHPQWGAPYIRVLLTKRYALAGIPAVRSLQKYFSQKGLTQARSTPLQQTIGRAKAPHNIWQIDAKERLVLTDGQPACYLTIVDEHSGADLDALVFPPQPY